MPREKDIATLRASKDEIAGLDTELASAGRRTVSGKRVGYDEAAVYLGVNISTLRSWVCRRQVPHIRLSGRVVVFDLAELDAHLAERRVAVGGAR